MSPSVMRPSAGQRRRAGKPKPKPKPPVSLPDQLWKCLEESKFDDRTVQFAPEGGIDHKILNEGSILKAMEIDPTTITKEEREVVNFILKEANKTFVIAVHINLEGQKLYKAMKLFKDNDFNDANGLPIEDPKKYEDADTSDIDQDYEYDGEDISEADEDEEASLADSDDDSAYITDHRLGVPRVVEEIVESEDLGQHKLASFDESLWTQSRISGYYEAQFKFLSPCLSTDKANYDLHKDSILPFTSKEFCGEGAFSKVWKVSIHKAHFKDPERPGECETLFAIKEISPGTNEKDRQRVIRNWEGEGRALKRVNELKQPHIIRFITGFRRGNPGEQVHYLMFEWADGGSLRDIWVNFPRPGLSADLIREMIFQLRGLADALVAVHNLDELGASYRHGDLKPENILCFKGTTSFGTLKIGDWGLAKQHNVGTEMRSKKTSTTHSTIRYDPPETSTGLPGPRGQTKDRISRLCDIWAMGCIILEFMIWMMYGYETLVRFNLNVKGKSVQDGPCYQPDKKNGAKVHDVVIQWMDHMAKDPICAPGTAMGDLLAIVRNKLLVVKLPPGMGSAYSPPHPPPGSRSPQQRPVSPSPSSQFGPSLMVTEPETDHTLSIRAPELNSGPYRALATTFRDALEDILSMDSMNSNYWEAGLGINRRGPPDASEAGTKVDLQPPAKDVLKKAKSTAMPGTLGTGLGLMVPENPKMIVRKPHDLPDSTY